MASEPGKSAPAAPGDAATADALAAAGSLDAWRFAADAHRGQRRDADRAPYIHHPERVALLVAEAGGDAAMITASLLHDIVEDTEIAPLEIAERFGPDVGELVAAMTDDRSIPDYEERKAALREQVRQAGPRATLIYAADKLANSRDLRGAYAEIGEAVAGRLKVSLEGRIRVWRGDLEMCRQELGESDLVAALDRELDALERDRARVADAAS